MSTPHETSRDGIGPGEGRWMAVWGDWTLVRPWLETPEREGARIIVSNQHGQILMLHRSPDAPTNPDMWTAPGGPLQPGEEPLAAAHRVLAAQIGLDSEVLAPLGSLGFVAPDDGAWVQHHVFTTQVTATVDDLRLGESQALRFFDWTELHGLVISPSARNALAIAWQAAATPPVTPNRLPGTDTGTGAGADSEAP